MKNKIPISRVSLVAFVLVFIAIWIISAFRTVQFGVTNLIVYFQSGGFGVITPFAGYGWENSGFETSPNLTPFPACAGLSLPGFDHNDSQNADYFWIPLWLVAIFLALLLLIFRTSNKSMRSSASRRMTGKLVLVSILSIAAAFMLPLAPNTLSSAVVRSVFCLIFVVVSIALIFRPVPKKGEGRLAVFVAAFSLAMTRTLLLEATGITAYSSSALLFVWAIFSTTLIFWLLLNVFLWAYKWLRVRWTAIPYLGNCLQCGYDLRRNEAGTCPECGTMIHEDQMRYLRKVDQDASELQESNADA